MFDALNHLWTKSSPFQRSLSTSNNSKKSKHIVKTETDEIVQSFIIDNDLYDIEIDNDFEESENESSDEFEFAEFDESYLKKWFIIVILIPNYS